jgi:hypothetical protein
LIALASCLMLIGYIIHWVSKKFRHMPEVRYPKNTGNIGSSCNRI